MTECYQKFDYQLTLKHFIREQRAIKVVKSSDLAHNIEVMIDQLNVKNSQAECNEINLRAERYFTQRLVADRKQGYLIAVPP